MTSTTQPEERLRTDALGRVRTPLARREQIVDEFERSGVSGEEFARLIGVKYPTLAAWVQARRKARARAVQPQGEVLDAAGAGRRMQWVEAVVAPQARGGQALRMDLPGGARLEIGDGAAGGAGGGAVAGSGAAGGCAVLSFAGRLRVFLALEPCDLRKSFNGLHALAAERLGEDPRGGGLFVFCNRRRIDGSQVPDSSVASSPLAICGHASEERAVSMPRSRDVAPSAPGAGLTDPCRTLHEYTDCSESPCQSGGEAR